MIKIKLGREALVLSILTLITVLTWIGFEVYWTLHRSTIPEITKKQMEPLDPNLKINIIENLKNNLTIPMEELNIVTVSTTTATQGGILE